MRVRWSLVVVSFALGLGCGSSSGDLDDGSVQLEDNQGLCSLPGDCGEGTVCVDQVCVPATCNDLQLSGNETDIDCGGDCPPCTEGQACSGFQDCASSFCRSDDSVCRDCNSDADCDATPGTHCVSGACVPRKDLGDQCGDSGECNSGWCVDGVCCDGPCDGACQTCGSDGVCDYTPAGGDSEGDCPSEGGCGLDGTCDGAGGCQIPAAGTPCTIVGCSGGSGTCDGAGVCDIGGGGCGTYACGPGDVCFDTCSIDDECAAGYYCNASNGTCIKKKGNGNTCNASNQCTSGHCVDGVCCNNSCGSTCYSCKGSQTGGSNGTCAPILPDTDPANECSDEGAASCGTTGMCSGTSSGCEVYPAGTQCAAASCMNNNAYNARTCDGSGTCQAATVDEYCAPYRCSGGSCYHSCTTNLQCQLGYTCIGNDCDYDPCQPLVTGEETPLRLPQCPDPY